MTVTTEVIRHEDYTIRWADERHAADFVSLHREVFGTWEPHGRAQFDWKYADNPFVEDLPVVVVEDEDGDLVGARGYFALPVRSGEADLLALQSSDLMVHPDHRRRGLFRQMNELGLSAYADEDTIFFSFPGAAARRGYVADGWTEVSNPVYVRLLEWAPETPTAPTDLLTFLGSKGMAAALTVLDRVAGAGRDYDVRVLADPDPDLLADLYRQNVPDGIHARRSGAFYEWRLAEPVQTHRAYVAERGGTVAGAAVVSEWNDNCQVREILPYGADTSAVAALLRAVARGDESEADFLRAWRPASLGRSALLAAGLLPETVLPFVSTSDDLVTLGGAGNTGGSDAAAPDPTDPDDWDIQLIERDY